MGPCGRQGRRVGMGRLNGARGLHGSKRWSRADRLHRLGRQGSVDLWRRLCLVFSLNRLRRLARGAGSLPCGAPLFATLVCLRLVRPPQLHRQRIPLSSLGGERHPGSPLPLPRFLALRPTARLVGHRGIGGRRRRRRHNLLPEANLQQVVDALGLPGDAAELRLAPCRQEGHTKLVLGKRKPLVAELKQRCPHVGERQAEVARALNHRRSREELQVDVLFWARLPERPTQKAGICPVDANRPLRHRAPCTPLSKEDTVSVRFSQQA